MNDDSNATILPISTKSTSSHLKLLKIRPRYDVRNPGPGLGQAQKVAGVKLVREKRYILPNNICSIHIGKDFSSPCHSID